MAGGFTHAVISQWSETTPKQPIRDVPGSGYQVVVGTGCVHTAGPRVFCGQGFVPLDVLRLGRRALHNRVDFGKAFAVPEDGVPDGRRPDAVARAAQLVREAHLLLAREPDPLEDQDLVRHERVVHRGHLVLAQRPLQVDALDVHAEVLADGRELHRLRLRGDRARLRDGREPVLSAHDVPADCSETAARAHPGNRFTA